MNGRVYDYNLVRFMSVDPLIHMEGGSQGINPYLYLMNNPMSGVDPTGYDPDKETIEVSKNAQVYEDADGNNYVEAGDGSGDMIKVDSITATKPGGTTVTANFDNGSVSSMSATKGAATFSVTDIGSQSQTSKLSYSGLEGNGGDKPSSQNSKFASDAFDAVSGVLGDAADSLAWTYDAVASGLKEDFSDGVAEGLVRFTGGRSNKSKLEEFRSNYAASSLIVGPITNADKKAVAALFSGELTKRNGGMTFGQWAKSGFAIAPHMQTRAATAAYVGRTTIINTAVFTFAWEIGTGIGSGARMGLNRSFRGLSDWVNDDKFKSE